MSGCHCNTRALTILLKDLAGLDIGQQAPRIQRLPRSRRSIGTRPSTFRQYSTQVKPQTNIDDGFIPWEGKERVQEVKEVDENWHAEVEVISSPEQKQGGTVASDESVQNHNGGEVATFSPSRAESRRLRKLRRIEAGTYMQTEKTRKQKESQEARQRRRPVLDLPAISKHHIPSPLFEPATWEKELVAELRREFEKDLASKQKPRRITRPKPALDLPAISQHMETHSRPWDWEQLALSELKRLRMKNGRIAREGEEHEYKSEAEAKTRVLNVLEILEKIEMPKGPWIPRSEVATKRKTRTEPRTEVKTAKPRRERAVKAKSVEDKPRQTELVQERHVKANFVEAEPEESKAKPKETAPKLPRIISKLSKEPEEPREIKKKENWQIQKAALSRKFGEQSWQPRKRVSPDTLEGIRALHASDPITYNTETLSTHFGITAEAVRRILKSKWKPNAEEIESRTKRWEKRGVRKWTDMAAQGIKPPKKWRALGLENPNLRRRKEREGGGGERKGKMSWEDVKAMADRLPMEGSLAERIL